MTNKTNSHESHSMLEDIFLHLEWHEAALCAVISIEDCAHFTLVKNNFGVWCVENGIINGLIFC